MKKMDYIDIDIDMETQYYRVPENVVERHRDSAVFRPLFVVSSGFREGTNKRVGYDVSKTSTSEYLVKYCLAGEGWFDEGGFRHKVNAGDMIICRRDTPHQYGTDEQNPWAVFWAYFYSEGFEEYYPAIKHRKSVVFRTGVHIKLVDFFRDIVLELKKGYAKPQLLYSSHLLQCCFSYMLSKYDTTSLGNKYDFDQVLAYMSENVDRELSIKELSSVLHLSKDHFIRLFNEKYGYTPLDYFIRIKMQQACNYIATTELSLSQIATILGYEDYYYFSRIFKSKVGYSPREYRKRNMN